MDEESFNRLKKKWDRILKRDGFVDIEKTATQVRLNPDHSRLEYFTAFNETVNDPATVFLNAIEEFVVRRFADGLFIKDIVEELILNGNPRDRRSVRFIIRRFEHRCKIRKWTRKGLGSYYDPQKYLEKKSQATRSSLSEDRSSPDDITA